MPETPPIGAYRPVGDSYVLCLQGLREAVTPYPSAGFALPFGWWSVACFFSLMLREGSDALRIWMILVNKLLNVSIVLVNLTYLFQKLVYS